MRSIGTVIVGAISVCGLVGINACASGPDAPAGAELGPIGETEQDLRRRTPCASSADCHDNQFCTTEIGDCRRPPGCRPRDICPAVCYGVCRPRREAVECGAVSCEPGEVCCNPSCGTCVEPGERCSLDPC